LQHASVSANLRSPAFCEREMLPAVQWDFRTGFSERETMSNYIAPNSPESGANVNPPANPAVASTVGVNFNPLHLGNDPWVRIDATPPVLVEIYPPGRPPYWIAWVPGGQTRI
jgi:hypothetical protein